MPALLRRKRRRPPRLLLLEAVVALRITNAKLAMAANRIRNTVLRRRDPDAERVLSAILKLQSTIEFVSLRLETLALANALASRELGVVKEVLETLRRDYANILPGIDSMLGEALNTISEAASSARIELPEATTPPMSEEVKRILEEAEKVAEERLNQLLPKPGPYSGGAGQA